MSYDLETCDMSFNALTLVVGKTPFRKKITYSRNFKLPFYFKCSYFHVQLFIDNGRMEFKKIKKSSWKK